MIWILLLETCLSLLIITLPCLFSWQRRSWMQEPWKPPSRKALKLNVRVTSSWEYMAWKASSILRGRGGNYFWCRRRSAARWDSPRFTQSRDAQKGFGGTSADTRSTTRPLLRASTVLHRHKYQREIKPLCQTFYPLPLLLVVDLW